MKTAVCCICFLLCIYPFGSYGMNEQHGKYLMDGDPAVFAGAGAQRPGVAETEVNREEEGPELTAMEALDLVKENYCANFHKICPSAEDDYYYKLSFAEYYLVYEGQGETEEEFLFHLYEFVLDEPETGIGHTVTYGWYRVNRYTGEVEETR